MADPGAQSSKGGFQKPTPALWTSLRYFSIARLVVAAILIGTVLVGSAQANLGQFLPGLFQRSVFSYFILAAVLSYLAVNRPYYFYAQLTAQLLLDLTVLTSLSYASGGVSGGLGVLFLLPVAGAAILMPNLWAIGFAAACVLAILGEAIWRELSNVPDVSFFQSGVYGVACFAMALVMNRLAARLMTQERIAEERGVSLQNQQEINRLVIADMQDGVLILSEEGEPRALNPAACRMLFIEDEYPLLRDGWGVHAAGLAIRNHFWEWVAEPGMVSDTLELIVTNNSPVRRDGVYEYRIRARFYMHARRITGGDHVVLLEDLQRLEERAQQLKLASMGRLTASIAHEIRNPLSAINHASALLAEETATQLERIGVQAHTIDAQQHVLQTKSAEVQLRMLQIVQDNTRRLDRIVQDILQLSRRTTTEPATIVLDEYLNQIVQEFCRDQSLPRERFEISVQGDPMLRFNAEQLRQVLINLLQNAARYATESVGSIKVSAGPVSGNFGLMARQQPLHARVKLERIEVMVQDDGPGVDPEVRPQLFEPFFTTDHKGTGLGLYLARELCVANGATLNYVVHSDEERKGRFVVNAAAALYRL